MGWKIGIFPIKPKPISQAEIDFYNQNMIICQKMMMAMQRVGPDGKPDPDKEMIRRCTFERQSIINEYLATGEPLPYDLNPMVARITIMKTRDMLRDNPPPRREDFGLPPKEE